MILIRHGETAWSKSGQHTGRTDIPLTEAGEKQAQAAGQLTRSVLAGRRPAYVISSPRQRALRTAELAGFTPDLVTEDAAEWDYGDFEGKTSPEINELLPGWSIWAGPVPGGESATDVATRFDRLLDTAGAAAGKSQTPGPVLIFAHGHAIRCLAARWLREPIASGRHYRLGTGAVSALAFEHAEPVISHWNIDNSII